MATATGRIFKQADRQGGDACVNGTRIPVWVLDNCRRLGMPDAQILLTYPSLTPPRPGSRLGLRRSQPGRDRAGHSRKRRGQQRPRGVTADAALRGQGFLALASGIDGKLATLT